MIFMKKRKAFLLAWRAGVLCLALYLALGFAVLFPALEKADGGAPAVPDTRYTGDFSVLLSSDELSHYALLHADFENERLTLTLFESRDAAKNHGFSIDRTVNYTRSAQIDLIGWLGGIVIDNVFCYNNEDYGLLKGERIFGVRATNLSAHDSELRAAVAYGVCRELLSREMTEKDFVFLLSLCESDISYADFYRRFPALASLKNNITVSIVG